MLDTLSVLLDSTNASGMRTEMDRSDVVSKIRGLRRFTQDLPPPIPPLVYDSVTIRLFDSWFPASSVIWFPCREDTDGGTVSL
jgi:hypothetical protein